MVGSTAASAIVTSGGTVDPRLQKATEDFEAMLIAELLKMSKSDDPPQGELDGADENYQDLRNQAVATAMASNGGIGIGRMLREHVAARKQH
ncbi:MAG TPA: rod-binding protein [Terriglobales bacterium]|nr:rod-binding protein [Terriglobales bacterium]